MLNGALPGHRRVRRTSAAGTCHAFSAAGSGSALAQVRPSSALSAAFTDGEDAPSSAAHSRRAWLQQSLLAASAVALAAPERALAREVTDASSGELPDLPPEAVRSYLQYRFPLQLSADFYIFDLQNMVRAICK